MHYKTINVHQSTYDRLLRYKHMGMTFDEALAAMLDELDPMEMYQAALEEHEKRLHAMRAGEYVTLEDIKKKHGAE